MYLEILDNIQRRLHTVICSGLGFRFQSFSNRRNVFSCAYSINMFMVIVWTNFQVCYLGFPNLDAGLCWQLVHIILQLEQLNITASSILRIPSLALFSGETQLRLLSWQSTFILKNWNAMLVVMFSLDFCSLFSLINNVFFSFSNILSLLVSTCVWVSFWPCPWWNYYKSSILN